MPGNPITDPNWAREVTDTIDRTIGKVRDTATSKAVKASRAIVFGLLAAILGLITVLLVLLVATRGLQAVLDLWVDRPVAVYLSYFIVGGILCLLGWLLLRKRRPRAI
ncbi:MAG: hypothetical protein MUE78_01900 [Ilumatobacteraceae bacterium]|jgi:uncharacterized RDD family membrane protein YckC|nr:hypothetical protein [Ilumatobacteraceae bacterium]